MPNRRGSAFGIAHVTLFLTMLAVGMLFGALLAPRKVWGQTVPRDGIEPPTPAASMRRSTPELSREGLAGSRTAPAFSTDAEAPPRLRGSSGIEPELPPLGHVPNIAPNATTIQPDGTTVSPRVLAIPVAALWLVSVYEIGALKEIHHEYYGAALLLARPRWMQWVGLAIMADDSYQHARQWSGDRNYRSPLHRAYAVTLYRWVVR